MKDLLGKSHDLLQLSTKDKKQSHLKIIPVHPTGMSSELQQTRTQIFPVLFDLL